MGESAPAAPRLVRDHPGRTPPTGSGPKIRRVSVQPVRIAIVDYGMGNLRSVEKALEHVGASASVSSDHDEIRAAHGIVLPGVGAFPEAMRRIRSRALEEPITERVEGGTPLIGICMGMQLLFERSSELGGAAGLGLLPGPVDALDPGAGKLPHIGWSPLGIERESPIVAGIAPAEPFYFVHSFIARPEAGAVVASCEHGERFAAVVASGNIFGAQFHPEKSSLAGLRMLRNFVGIAAPVAAPA